MADSPIFEWACTVLEKATTMNKLQARGTLRLVLEGAGLDSSSLTSRQFKVVAAKLLPKELRVRRIQNVDALCAELADVPRSVEMNAEDKRREQPEDVFRRLGHRQE